MIFFLFFLEQHIKTIWKLKKLFFQKNKIEFWGAFPNAGSYSIPIYIYNVYFVF
jgi:hypothetical protein